MKTLFQEKVLVEEQKVTESFSKEKKKKKGLGIFLNLLLAFCIFITGVCAGFLLDRLDFSFKREEEEEKVEEIDYGVPSWVTPAVIRVDGQSRRGEKLEAVRDIAIHYVANPGSSAMGNRNFFDGPDSTTSAHFIVGLEGEVLLCVPLDEKSSATNERNLDTISIEVCHPDETGEFLPETYESLLKLISFLCDKYDLTEENLIRHYDVTGKLCPKFYVEHPEAWEQLKQDVAAKIK